MDLAAMDPSQIDPSFTGMQVRALGINGAFIGITVIVMGIRLYTRLLLQRSMMGWDDYMMIIGALATIGLSVNTIVAVHLGVGRLMSQIPLPWTDMLLAIFCTRVIYCIGILFVKASLLLFYLRLDHRRYMRWAVWFLIVNVVANSVAGAIVSIIGCIPPDLFWKIMENPEAAAKNCLPQDHLQIFWDTCGAHVIASDIAIWVLPIPMVWQLNFSKRLKWAVSGIFALGIFAVAASCVRFYYVRALSNQTEQYYQLADSLNWCALELHVAIICGSSSCLKAFLKQHFPAVLGASTSGTSRGGSKSRGLNYTPTTSDGHPLSNLSARGHHVGHNVTVSASNPKNRGYLVMDETGNDSGSEKAIIPGGGHIVMKREIRQEATTTT